MLHYASSKDRYSTYKESHKEKISAMNQVVTIKSDIAISADLAKKFRADETVRSYQTGAEQFRSYCDMNGIEFMPAEPQAVVGFIGHLCAAGLSVSTIRSRVHAIKWLHKSSNNSSPTDHPLVEMTMQGMARVRGEAPKQAKAMLASTVKVIVDGCVGDLSVRDRALILTGFFGGFRRGELAAMRREHIEFSDNGMSIYLPTSKTDQFGAGRWVPISRQPSGGYCPVEAMTEWLDVSEPGSVFKISDRQVGNIIKKLCGRAGIDPAEYSAHSLRAGMVTQAALNGAEKRDIRTITGHKSDTMIDQIGRAHV